MDIRAHVITLNETRARVFNELKAVLDDTAGRERNEEEKAVIARLDARIDELDAEVREYVARETRESEAAELRVSERCAQVNLLFDCIEIAAHARARTKRRSSGNDHEVAVRTERTTEGHMQIESARWSGLRAQRHVNPRRCARRRGRPLAESQRSRRASCAPYPLSASRAASSFA